MNILIADDDPIALYILKNALVEAGHTVECAANGREALDQLHAGDCRLVIADWDMPEMTGEELCRAVRDENFPGYIYFILLTCHSTPNYIVTGLSAGADDFIGKPFNPDELVVRVRAGERVLAMETRDLAIFALAKLAESRDPETGGHLERIRQYCHVLAKHLQESALGNPPISGEFVRMLYLTSPLHDIGKVGIPDSVLLKPDRLSDEEFRIMKTHSSIGADTLDAAIREFPNTQFLRMARDIAATHHERFDGTGYPAGLAGADIPLAGRIVALADVYDALTSKRVYKRAFPHDVARSIIVQESGTHFDPVLVEAFLATEGEFVDIGGSRCPAPAPAAVA